jgi:hypothetical protein
MSTIHFSIWGIRDGFERNGMFHTHDISSVKALQKDRFRDISTKVGSSGFYMIHRTGGYLMISFVNTRIREARTTSELGRPGHVVFSLIFPENLQLNQSPRLILKAISDFYAERVKDGTKNNFEAEEILHYISGLSARPRNTQAPFLSGSHFTYYSDESQLDEFLTGDASIAHLSEWLWLYNPPNANGTYANAIYWEGSYFDVAKVRQERTISIERQKKEEIDRRNEEQQHIQYLQALEKQLNTYIEQGAILEALKVWNDSPYKLHISPNLKAALQREEDKINANQVKAQHQKEDNDCLEELNRAFRGNNLDLALTWYNKLHDKTHPRLAIEVKQKLQVYEQDKLQQQAQEEDRMRSERADSERKRKRNKGIIIGGVAGVILLFVLSFFTMFPAFLWDSDGDGFHNYRNDNCPAVSGTCQGCLDSDNDGFVDSEDECPKESSTTCKGCPDSDNDGVADKADSCLNEMGSSNCSGCPDSDNDGVQDSLDHCKDVPGVKYMHGCPDTDAPEEPKTMDDTQKLQNGEAVMVPKAFGNYVVTKKWLRLKNNRYEYSDYEKTAYKPVSKNETVEKLNAFYGLQVPLPQENPQPPKGPVGPKPPKAGLTDSEQSELIQLIAKEQTGKLLTTVEQRRKKELEIKKGKQ